MSAASPADRSFRALVRACFSPRQMEELAESLMKQALGGSVEAARILLHYRDGPPKQEIEVTAPQTITITTPIIQRAMELQALGLPEDHDAKTAAGGDGTVAK